MILRTSVGAAIRRGDARGCVVNPGRLTPIPRRGGLVAGECYPRAHAISYSGPLSPMIASRYADPAVHELGLEFGQEPGSDCSARTRRQMAKMQIAERHGDRVTGDGLGGDLVQPDSFGCRQPVPGVQHVPLSRRTLPPDEQGP